MLDRWIFKGTSKGPLHFAFQYSAYAYQIHSSGLRSGTMVWFLRALEYIDLILCACFTGIYHRLKERTTGVHRTKLSQLKIVILLAEAKACSQPEKELNIFYRCILLLIYFIYSLDESYKKRYINFKVFQDLRCGYW